jgi:hypothetical protein
MNETHDPGARLREADPVGREPGLSPEALADMRRNVVATARRHEHRVVSRPRVFAIAATAALVAVATVAIVRRPDAGRVAPVAPSTVSDQGRPTQVHFSTPGGTRIIWTIDPAFHLGGTRP